MTRPALVQPSPSSEITRSLTQEQTTPPSSISFFNIFLNIPVTLTATSFTWLVASRFTPLDTLIQKQGILKTFLVISSFYSGLFGDRSLIKTSTTNTSSRKAKVMFTEIPRATFQGTTNVKMEDLRGAIGGVVAASLIMSSSKYFSYVQIHPSIVRTIFRSAFVYIFFSLIQDRVPALQRNIVPRTAAIFSKVIKKACWVAIAYQYFPFIFPFGVVTILSQAFRNPTRFLEKI